MAMREEPTGDENSNVRNIRAGLFWGSDVKKYMTPEFLADIEAKKLLLEEGKDRDEHGNVVALKRRDPRTGKLIDDAHLIATSPEYQVANALPGSLRKEMINKLASDPTTRDDVAKLAAEAAAATLRESLPAILEQATRIAKR